MVLILRCDWFFLMLVCVFVVVWCCFGSLVVMMILLCGVFEVVMLWLMEFLFL